jgi:hypothetical protein
VKTASSQQMQQHRFRLVFAVMACGNVTRPGMARLFAQEAVALPPCGFFDSGVGVSFTRSHWYAPHNDIES